MEKQMKEETTMEENKKKNPDSERKSKLVSAILMAFVCVVMMGGGTYAWFTMNNVARVESLKLNVASEGNLYISKTNNFEAKKSEVDWFEQGTTIKTLYPCTMDSSRNVYKPVYESDKVVSGKELVEANEAKDTYYLEETFYLKLDDGLDGNASHSEYSVKLAEGTSTTSGQTTTYDGTYFKLDTGVVATQNPSYCVRVSFTPDGGDTVVYEPNSDKNNDGDNAESSLSPYAPIATTLGCTQKENGKFVKNDNDIGDSEELFAITGGTAKAVVVRVWFEGTDDDCCNEIEIKDIIAQLKFVATKKDA